MGLGPIFQRTEGGREGGYGGRGAYTVDNDVSIGVSRLGEKLEWIGSRFTQKKTVISRFTDEFTILLIIAYNRSRFSFHGQLRC